MLTATIRSEPPLFLLCYMMFPLFELVRTFRNCTSHLIWIHYSTAYMLILILILLITVNPVLSQPVETLPGFPGKLPFKLETGYVGVGHLDTIQLFYYFIESERNPEDDPLLLWLSGGPGCSGFSPLVYEVGPLLFDYAKSSSGSGKLPTLKLNPYSWTKVASMIFIDVPAGTGFSYTTNWEHYKITDTLSAAQTYEFLQKWLLSHPQFLKNPLYISGDSYAGIILPIVVKKISDGIEAGHNPQMNLQGYVLGNPVTYANADINGRIPFYHKTGLISDKLYESTKRNCQGEYINVDPSNGACLVNLEVVSQCVKMIYKAQILEPLCDAETPLSGATQDNHLKLLLPTSSRHRRLWCRYDNYALSYIWANDGEVKTALHIQKKSDVKKCVSKIPIPNLPLLVKNFCQGIKHWMRCNTTLSYTFDVTSTLPYHECLTKKDYKVLIYSGDHDGVIPYISTMTWIKSLNLSLKRDWEPWYADGQVGGYTLQYTHKNYSLVYATVKGGGHTAPEYKPKECFYMFSTWLAGFPI